MRLLFCPSVNKKVFSFFPYPGMLTFVHYLVSLVFLEALRRAGFYQRRAVETRHWKPFVGLLINWSLCNALSNVSLERNSVGFYQMMKVLSLHP